MGHMVLTPAYGRDYKSRAEILVHLLDEKDFICESHERRLPINLQQMHPGLVLNVRYSKLRKVAVFEVVLTTKATIKMTAKEQAQVNALRSAQPKKLVLG